MKERVGTESTTGSIEINPGGISGGTTIVDVLLHQQSKALSTDNSLSSANAGEGLLDASANATAASSPATLPLRLQQPQPSFNLEIEGSCCSSAINSQGASRASTLSLKKKKVNIATKKKMNARKDADIDSDLDLEAAHETTALNHLYNLKGGCSDSLDSRTTTPADNYLTMSGTITRGKRAGQQTDVKVNISREELEIIESTHAKLKAGIEQSSGDAGGEGTNGARTSKTGCCHCGVKRGLHIAIWSFLCFPFVFLFASIYSFYMGTLTWYNVFSWYTEEKPFLCRILMAPILIISYPVFILMATFGLGVYAAFSQLTFQWFVWVSHARDLEKGFYARLCSLINLEECSPYTEVVIVAQLDRVTSSQTTAHQHQG